MQKMEGQNRLTDPEYNKGKTITKQGGKIMATQIPISIGTIYPGGPCRGVIHVVQRGDSLYQLGKFYHVSVGQLIFANPFVDIYNLQIGDELCIPAVLPPVSARSGEQNRYQEFEGWEEEV